MAILRFGDCELDDARPELRRDGRRVAIPPKALELLVHLARNRDRVVSRTELHERLWPDRVVGDSALKHWLRRVRRAVGDAGPRHHVIKTQHKVGLRFVARASVREADVTASPLATRVGSVDAPVLPERADALRRLEQALERAAAGAGGSVLVGGEPGIGKSHLARALAAIGRRRGIPSYVGRALAEAGVEDLWLWGQVLEDLIRDHPPAELAEALGAYASDLVPLVPELGPKLSMDPSLASQPAEEPRFRLFRAVSHLLLDLPGPRVIVLEDLQWCDATSLALLESLLPELGSSRLLLVMTYREEELPQSPALRSTLANAVRSADAVDLHLGELSPAGVAELARRAMGRTLEREAAEALHARAGGNPLFVLELVRDDAGATAPGALAALPPPVLRRLIARRLGRLSGTTRELLATAALAGDFAPALLGRSSGLSAEAVLAALEEAAHARVVAEVVGAPYRYRFVPGLVGEVVVAELEPVRRAELHRRLGEAIEALHANDLVSHLEALARHFGEALAVGAADKALAYAERAARLEAERGRHEESERHHARALAAREAARARR